MTDRVLDFRNLYARESASPQGAKGCFLASSLSSVRLERTAKFEAWAKCLSCQMSPCYYATSRSVVSDTRPPSYHDGIAAQRLAKPGYYQPAEVERILLVPAARSRLTSDRGYIVGRCDSANPSNEGAIVGKATLI